MSTPFSAVPAGIIEGFYGRPYPRAGRSFLAGFLAGAGFDFYIYAPKNDARLRKNWQSALSGADFSDLAEFCTRLHDLGLKAGIGISPLGLDGRDAAATDFFVRGSCKLAETLHCELFALLFDDIKNEQADAARRQHLIIRKLREALPSCTQTLLFCPSYYSDDPILDKIFGHRPPRYLEELTEDLPEGCSMFWTGSKVVPEDILPEDLSPAGLSAGVPLSIWDNYPVNDSKRLCSRLLTAPFRGRRGLQGKVFMHACNPMTEPVLSCLALCSLPLIHAGASDGQIRKRRLEVLELLTGGRAAEFDPYLERLQQGVEFLEPAAMAELRQLCRCCGGPAAGEIMDFLDGKYAFDPACLT